MIKIAPSILSADFSCLGDEIRKIEIWRAGGEKNPERDQNVF